MPDEPKLHVLQRHLRIQRSRRVVRLVERPHLAVGAHAAAAGKLPAHTERRWVFGVTLEICAFNC